LVHRRLERRDVRRRRDRVVEDDDEKVAWPATTVHSDGWMFRY
jgi:hypothetical protein